MQYGAKLRGKINFPNRKHFFFLFIHCIGTQVRGFCHSSVLIWFFPHVKVICQPVAGEFLRDPSAMQHAAWPAFIRLTKDAVMGLHANKKMEWKRTTVRWAKNVEPHSARNKGRGIGGITLTADDGVLASWKLEKKERWKNSSKGLSINHGVIILDFRTPTPLSWFFVHTKFFKFMWTIVFVQAPLHSHKRPHGSWMAQTNSAVRRKVNVQLQSQYRWTRGNLAT